MSKKLYEVSTKARKRRRDAVLGYIIEHPDCSEDLFEQMYTEGINELDVWVALSELESKQQIERAARQIGNHHFETYAVGSGNQEAARPAVLNFKNLDYVVNIAAWYRQDPKISGLETREDMIQYRVNIADAIETLREIDAMIARDLAESEQE